MNMMGAPLLLRPIPLRLNGYARSLLSQAAAPAPTADQGGQSIQLPPGFQLPPGMQLPPGTQVVQGGGGGGQGLPTQYDETDPVQNLAVNGAILEVEISVPDSVAAAMKAQGQTVPPPQRARGLIDTGASISGIKPAIASAAQLTQTSSVTISGVVGSEQRPIYAAAISLPEYGVSLDAIDIAGVDLPQQDINVLIGRDVLQRLTLIYQGKAGAFNLEDTGGNGFNMTRVVAGSAIVLATVAALIGVGAFD